MVKRRKRKTGFIWDVTTPEHDEVGHEMEGPGTCSKDDYATREKAQAKAIAWIILHPLQEGQKLRIIQVGADPWGKDVRRKLKRVKGGDLVERQG